MRRASTGTRSAALGHHRCGGPIQGWVHIVVSLLCCALPIRVLLLFLRDWDRVTQSSTPIWVGLVTTACYAAKALGFLSIGHFLLTGRIKLLKFGGAYCLAAVVTGTTLFAVFD